MNYRGDYRMCSRCAMDTSDPAIIFDDRGMCNHCTRFLALRSRLAVGGERERRLASLVAEIKASGERKKYDCIVGVSGGVDSTYVAYVSRALGLRPLAVHVDNGWNSELAVYNIESALKVLGIDLYTRVLDWEQFRDLQLSMLRASVVDAELPTDHAIRAVLIEAAVKNRVKYILNGRNLSTEGILPWAWSYSALDWRYLKAIHLKFGTKSRSKYPHLTLARLARAVVVRRLKNISILNLVDYSKAKAKEVLRGELGWRDYGGKHHESIYTRFFQSYILPRKFGIDKRRAHLSVLICTGEVSRIDALSELENPTATDECLVRDREYVCKKLGIRRDEFDTLMQLPVKTYQDYPNQSRLLLLHANRKKLRWVRVLKQCRVLPSGFADYVTQLDAGREAAVGTAGEVATARE